MIVGAGRVIGGCLAGLVSGVPTDLVGVLAGDRINACRAARIAELNEDDTSALPAAATTRLTVRRCREMMVNEETTVS